MKFLETVDGDLINPTEILRIKQENIDIGGKPQKMPVALDRNGRRHVMKPQCVDFMRNEAAIVTAAPGTFHVAHDTDSVPENPRFELTPVIAWRVSLQDDDAPVPVLPGRRRQKPSDLPGAIQLPDGRVVDGDRTHADLAAYKTHILGERRSKPGTQIAPIFKGLL